jgi:hypothetical protein
VRRYCRPYSECAHRRPFIEVGRFGRDFRPSRRITPHKRVRFRESGASPSSRPPFPSPFRVTCEVAGAWDQSERCTNGRAFGRSAIAALGSVAAVFQCASERFPQADEGAPFPVLLHATAERSATSQKAIHLIFVATFADYHFALFNRASFTCSIWLSQPLARSTPSLLADETA